MLYSVVCRVLGKYFCYFSAILCIPFAVSLFYEFYLQEPFNHSPVYAFGETLIVSLLLALILLFFGRNAKEDSLHKKEGILLVVSIWFLTAAIAALPFLFSHTFLNPVDAYFESMSGLTTTGATIIHPKAYDPISGQEIPVTMQNPVEPSIHYTFYGTVAPLRDPHTGTILRVGVEALGKPLLFWRSFLQWLGGIGVVVLFIAILPSLSGKGKFLYESETTGPTKEGLTPRIKDTASFLWKVYIGLTLAQICLLLATAPTLPFFDAITLSFSTISTGGFTVHNECLPHYLNTPSLFVLALFMVLGGLNFSLYFYCLKRKFYRMWQPELYYYFLIMVIGCLLVSWGLWHRYPLHQALGYGAFQAISAQTSTGFSITDYDVWPFASQFVMIILMYIGGMSGSTAGGIKIIRFVIVWKVIRYKIESFFHRDVFHVLKVGDKEITDKTASTTLSFFCIVLFLVILGTYVLVLDNNDPLTALAIISTAINNTGLYFAGIGCTASLAFLSDFSKMVTVMWMVLGRLEFFSILALLFRSFWKS